MMEQHRIKVAIFQQSKNNIVPAELQRTILFWIQSTNANIEFIVGDGRGFDSAVHNFLSSIGMKDNTTIYCMDHVNQNNYHMKEKLYKLEYEPDEKKAYILNDAGVAAELWSNIDSIDTVLNDRKYYTFRDKQMCRDADTALIAWDGQSHSLQSVITTLKVLGKPLYIYNI